ncbi:hypothetical protein IQ270_21635 [Microcoleus sp. LEGE 07076]|uniref:hypothetical protein n=1 Tax=Microcoleus sp. LEGE 07076 TaxID=915322 RepID=UPI001880ED93|nr:hypothetical protein [Microcoleus sp. LEGE 07076]MBE9187183.1 hypothetical protein [Microcoleus sp. LEGE 07076]
MSDSTEVKNQRKQSIPQGAPFKQIDVDVWCLKGFVTVTRAQTLQKGKFYTAVTATIK